MKRKKKNRKKAVNRNVRSKLTLPSKHDVNDSNSVKNTSINKQNSDGVILKFVKSKVFALSFGALVSISLFFLSSYKMRPSFTYDDPKEVLNIKDTINGLTALFNNRNITNLYVVRFVFWNAGNKEIDISNFSKDYPIEIILPNEIQIQSYKIQEKSRESLNFDTQLIDEKVKTKIKVSLIGDDALEKNDGAALNIYYSGILKSKFEMSGRIKGAKDGFKHKSWDSAVRRQLDMIGYFKLVNMIIWTLLGIFMYRNEIISFNAGRKNNLYIANFFFFPTIFLNIYVMSFFFRGIDWIY